jgi:Asp-tRNA(Asn)/Glu-tRNA(Gln) amidotransferase A subunit family amidase
MQDFDEIYAWHMDLMAADTAAFHIEWFAEYGSIYHPKTTALIEQGKQVSAEQVATYKAKRQQVRQELQSLMQTHNISIWISPSAPGTAPTGLESTGNPVMNLPWTFIGVPAVNLPSGLADNGLPLGLQLTAAWQQDEKLLVWAAQIAAALR